jgi:1-phosphofructokinase family hexose kinase
MHYLKVIEPGPHVTDTDAEAMLDKISTLLKKGDWWVLAGSTPPGIGPGFITESIHRIQAAGATAILDMQGTCLQAGCEANAFLVKPNASEAGELLGCLIRNRNEAHSALARIHELGARQVVISLGEAGAVYSIGTGGWWANPPTIEARNPIGAGDAMLAGMIWAFQMGITGREVLKWGVASGAAAASLDGTAVGSLQLIESLANGVQLGDIL